MKFLTTIGDGAAVVEVETETGYIERYDSAMDREYEEAIEDVIAVRYQGVDIIKALSADVVDTLNYEANLPEVESV